MKKNESDEKRALLLRRRDLVAVGDVFVDGPVYGYFEVLLVLSITTVVSKPVTGSSSTMMLSRRATSSTYVRVLRILSGVPSIIDVKMHPGLPVFPCHVMYRNMEEVTAVREQW